MALPRLPQFKLTTPVQLGDLGNPITVDALEVTAISFQFDPLFTGAKVPQMIASIMLRHPASGWSHNVVYKGDADGAAALAWFDSTFALNLVTAVLNKLIADGKLPAGTLA